MTTLLIVEGNTPASVAAGQSGAAGFLRTFAIIAPGTRHRVVNPHALPLPGDVFDGIDGVIFTGSGEPWSTGDAEAAPQRAAMEAALATGLPVWGSCNGMQLAAVVLGGASGPSPNDIEVGLARDLRLSDAGRTHPMMFGRADGFAVPCIHRDEVRRLPECATLLAGNAHSPVQAMACRTGGVDVWATQYHPELSPRDIAAYVRARGIFAHLAGMADLLEAAETDPDVTMRLGVSPTELAPRTRARELGYWLEHVMARAAPPAVA